MGSDRSLSRAAAALFALAALSQAGLARGETPQSQIEALKAELAATKGELSRTQSALDSLEKKVDALTAAAPAAAEP